MSLSIGMETIDCTDPQSLAGFWTAALGTTVVGDYGGFVLLGGTPADSDAVIVARTYEFWARPKSVAHHRRVGPRCTSR